MLLQELDKTNWKLTPSIIPYIFFERKCMTTCNLICRLQFYIYCGQTLLLPPPSPSPLFGHHMCHFMVRRFFHWAKLFSLLYLIEKIFLGQLFSISHKFLLFLCHNSASGRIRWNLCWLIILYSHLLDYKFTLIT